MSSDPVTVVRAEDLLEEAGPARRAAAPRVPPRRRLAGLIAALAGLPLLTLALVNASDALSLESIVLLYLVVVVIAALLGGMLIGLPSAVVAALLINFFFVEPLHTLDVREGEQALALAIFVAVAAVVSGAMEVATSRARAAELAREQAETLSTLAGADLDGRETLRGVLERARRTFGMQTVALKRREPESGAWIDVERVGLEPRDAAPLRFDVAAGELRLVGRGPALFAEDQRVLDAFAAAAQTAYEGRRLSEQARAGRELAAVDRQRTALLAAVGHDLRTPLAGIKAAVSSLLQTDVQWTPQDRRELLTAIETSADRLDGIVTNLLDASRLQAGAVVVHAEPIALDEVVGSALLALNEGADRVRVAVPDDLPLVLADPGLLERVLVNLLDNALRYDGGGAVDVRAVAGGRTAKLEVADHGPGVPDAARERLFEPFQRLDDRGGGVGLGLSVVRGFAEAMGGAVAADRGPDGGMIMRVRLPLAGVSA